MFLSYKIFFLLFLCGTAVAQLQYLKCVYLSRVATCVESKYRTIDGTCNNLKDKNFGKGYWPYGRMITPTYSDGKHDLPLQTDKTPYPSARIISNLIFPDGDPKSKEFTLAFMSIGQLVAHDLALAEGTQAGYGSNSDPVGCCTNTKLGPESNESICAADILIPPNDPDYSASGQQCMAFGRTSTTARYLCYLKDFDEQINLVTSFLDLSMLYGSLLYPAKNLRTYSDGLLKSESRNGQQFPPTEKVPKSVCPRAKPSEKKCYLTGDERANQNPQLTTLQIMLLNAHNNIAAQLKQINPDWKDETLFEETRRISIALWQHAIYDEFLPNLIGLETIKKYGLSNPKPGTCLDDYDDSVDASTRQEFATGAYRYFHTLIYGDINTYSNNREILQTIKLSDWIDRGEINELSKDINYNTLAVGLTVQPSAETDQFYDPEIKSKFFKNDDTGLGVDLLSFDIQRSRDHGIARYLEVRRFCNLSVAKNWEELVGDLSQSTVDKFKQIYKNVESIEYIAAGHLEKHLEGAVVGPTHACVIGLQFKITRTGDRYFYENCESYQFTSAQLASIKKVTLAKLFCQTTDMDKIQAQVTKIVGPDNPLVKCDDIPDLDLTLWKNEKLQTESIGNSIKELPEKGYNFYNYIQGLAAKYYG